MEDKRRASTFPLRRRAHCLSNTASPACDSTAKKKEGKGGRRRRRRGKIEFFSAMWALFL
jgi:hypothetical protein